MDVANVGVAPFYYDWPVKFAYLDNSGRIVASASADKNASDVASGATTRFSATLDLRRASAGTYTLIAQGANPLTGGIPIRFANAQQDATKDGWLTLGTTSVTSGGHPVHPGPPVHDGPVTGPPAHGGPGHVPCPGMAIAHSDTETIGRRPAGPNPAADSAGRMTRAPVRSGPSSSRG